MNDTEIIKALECCTTREGDNDPCHQCQCYDDNAGWCNDLPYAEVLALIRRQRAEIESLKAEHCLTRDISNAVAKDFIKANESCCQDLEIEIRKEREK